MVSWEQYPQTVSLIKTGHSYISHPALSFGAFTETNTYTEHFHSYIIHTIIINLTKFKVLRLKCAIFLPSSHNCYKVVKTCHFEASICYVPGILRV